VERLYELFRAVGNSLDLEETLGTLDRELARLVGYEAISVHLVEGDRLVLVHAAGTECHLLAALEPPPASSFLARAVETHRPQHDERLEGLGRLERALAIPLEQEGAVVAALTVYHTASRFSSQDREILLALGPKLAAAIGNARNFQRTEKLAGIDPLTSLLNTRSLFERLDAEVARACRAHSRLAVLDCALQGLPGPADGGEMAAISPVISKVAGALRECCREYDFVARSGDDFVLVLVDFAPGSLSEKRARIAAMVEEIGLSTGFPLSIRIGAAFLPHDGCDAEDLLAAAAQRLHPGRGPVPGTSHEHPGS
jgi:diguanylate cyclase (GGDEF)-like protein